MLTRVVLFLALLALTAESAFAQGPNFSFDATYEIIGPFGKGSLRQASDGKGHMLQENTAFNGNKDILILDYIKKVTTVLVVREKTAIQTEMKNPNRNLIYDEESVRKPGAKLIGTKIFNGHPCHGWEITQGPVKSQTWIGDDTKYLVYGESSSGKMKMIKSLKRWSNKAPLSSEFQVPTEYKITALPDRTAQDSSTPPGMEVITQLLQANKPAEAVEHLNKLIDKNPKDKALLIVRAGILYRSLHKPDDALKDFNRAIKLDPNWFQVYKRRGEYFAFVGKDAEAMADFNKCLSLAPEYGDVYVWRALQFAKQGKCKEALEDLDKAEKYHARNVAMLEKVRAVCKTAIEKRKP